MPRLETRLENKESKNVSLPRHGPHAMGSRATSLTCLFYPILSPPISHLSSQPAPPPISTLPSVSPPHFPCFSKSRVNDLSSQFGPWTEVFPLKKWRDSRSRAEMKNVLSRVFVLTKKKKKKKKNHDFFCTYKVCTTFIFSRTVPPVYLFSSFNFHEKQAENGGKHCLDFSFFELCILFSYHSLFQTEKILK